MNLKLRRQDWIEAVASDGVREINSGTTPMTALPLMSALPLISALLTIGPVGPDR